MRLHISANPRFERAGSATRALAPLDAALLAWLALEGPTPRARLAQLLWPQKDSKAARNSLRQRLFQLRKAAGIDLVQGSTTLSLVEGLSHDLDDADTVLGQTAAEDLAPGEFAQWLQQQRARRHNRMRRSLVEFADMAEGAHDWDDALTHARELLALEPLSEDAHRRVMRLHYLAGDRAAALLAFDRCEQVLKDEVGARPSAETLALLTAIGQPPGPAALVASTAPPASVSRPPHMIGRDAELRAFERAWQGDQVVAVIGEAGLGKTRLLQSFCEGRAGIARAAGRPGDAGVPFATLARLLRAVMAPADGPSPQLEPLPLATRSEIARVLPEFEAQVARPAGEGQRLVMQRAVRSLLAANPGIEGLIVDDLHFVDEASLDMVAALIDTSDAGEPGAADPPPLRVALAYRPADAGSPVQALHDALVEQARLVPMALAPLDERALAALVDSLVLPGVEGKALAPGLARRTGGNPLFVLETLKQAWVERTLDQLADERLMPRPLSVNRLIERRVAQLSPPALALARVASIAGVDFDIALAEHVLGGTAMQFADALNELEAAQVMRGNTFAHDLVFDAVRASVPATIARHTHARVAAWLEQRGSEPARVARHWIDGHLPLQAVVWLERAAERARAALRFKEFISFLEQKSAIEEASGDKAAAFESMLRATEEYLNVDRGQAIGEANCARLEQLAATPQQRVEAMLQRATLEKEGVDAQGGLATARSALRESLPMGDARLIAMSHHSVATALVIADLPTQATPHFEACIAWVETHGSDDDRCELHSNLAILYDNQGRLDEALPHHERAITLSNIAGNQSNAAVVLGNLACNRIDAGDLHAAREHVEQGLRIMGLHDEIGGNRGLLQALLALCSCATGRYRDALAHAELAIDAIGRHARPYLAEAHLQAALCWRHLGQWARVQRVLDLPDVRDSQRAAPPVRVALLRHALEVALGKPCSRALERALAGLPDGERPDLRLPLLIEHATTLTPHAALRQLEAVQEQARALQHESSLLAAHVQAAAVAATIDPFAAARHAEVAMALAERRQSTCLMPAAYWLHCAVALQAAGHPERADALTRDGAAWIERTARDQVLPEFRDGFLHRNPVNRALLALVARLTPR